ncbi:hypothetical protein [Bradyrhizobium sp. BR 1432]|uniref:hypothetical protein n=1 Tax=Bradyrhizobium sp. BR 1432 TaxID=3447966 RepID=UPI003EE52FD8
MRTLHPPESSIRQQGEFALARTIVAGLIAGAVMNIGEFLLNGVLMLQEWNVAMLSLNRPPVEGVAIAMLTAMTFALGLLTMGLRAMISPAVGTAGRSTVVAASIAWALAYGLGFGWSFAMGVFPARIYLATLAWGFVEMQVATAAGAAYERSIAIRGHRFSEASHAPPPLRSADSE